MGKIIIKFCRKSYSNDQDIRNLFAYIAGKGKNSEKETAVTGSKGLSRDCYKAAEQVIAAQRLLKKNKGRRILHIVISFKYRWDPLGVESYAEKAANYIFKEYPLYYGIHRSTEHVHIHIAVNRVNYLTNKKMHLNIEELKDYRKGIRTAMIGKIKKR